MNLYLRRGATCGKTFLQLSNDKCIFILHSDSHVNTYCCWIKYIHVNSGKNILFSFLSLTLPFSLKVKSLIQSINWFISVPIPADVKARVKTGTANGSNLGRKISGFLSIYGFGLFSGLIFFASILVIIFLSWLL